MSSPEVLAVAHQLTLDAAALAEETGSACFERNTSDLCPLAGAMLARAVQSLLSTDSLARQGFVGDAMSCSRTAVELAIDFAYIARDPTLIARFMDYGGVYHHKLASNVVKHGGVVPAAVITELQRKRDDFRSNNTGTLGTWAGVQIGQRAIAAGREVLYNLSYADQCNATHSGVGTLLFTQVLVGDELLVNFGPVEPSTHPIALAVTALAVLIGDVTIGCGLDESLGYRSVAIAAGAATIADNTRGTAGATAVSSTTK